MNISVKVGESIAAIASTLASKSNCQIEQACSSGTPIPQFSKLVQLIKLLRDGMFPRFREVIETESIEDVLNKASSLLAELICQAYVTAGIEAPDNPSDLAGQYINLLPGIREALLTDLQAAYEGDPACKSTDEVALCYPGFTAVVVYRLAHQLHKMEIPLLPRMMAEWVHGKTGIDIHPQAQIGRHFFIDHGTGVVIGATCVIGEHVKIYQGVTLGALSFQRDEQGALVRDRKRHPTIEDHVVIYANATVLGGNTTVGHHSVVGSSVWLVKSVAPHTTVVMEKPKLRMRSDSPSEFDPPIDFQI